MKLGSNPVFDIYPKYIRLSTRDRFRAAKLSGAYICLTTARAVGQMTRICSHLECPRWQQVKNKLHVSIQRWSSRVPRDPRLQMHLGVREIVPRKTEEALREQTQRLLGVQKGGAASNCFPMASASADKVGP